MPKYPTSPAEGLASESVDFDHERRGVVAGRDQLD
jgi:hypothetical protein